MESIRKDSEDVFGILKKRFRVLRLPFLLPNEQDIDNTFRVCCMLHNMSLDERGFNDIGNKSTDWLTPSGDVVLDERFQTALALSRKCSQITASNGQPAIATAESDYLCVRPLDVDPADIASVEIERGFQSRREALVAHYNYVAQNNQTMWLKPKTGGENDGECWSD